LLEYKEEVLSWLRDKGSRGFLQWAEKIKDYNLNKLRTSSDMPAVMRAQGAYELAMEILEMEEFLGKHIAELEAMKKKKEGAQHGMGS